MKLNKRDYLFLGAIAVVSIFIGAYLWRNRKPGSNSAQDWFVPGTRWFGNAKTREIITNLHPAYRQKFAEFLSKIETELGLTALATSGYRSVEEQKVVYAQNPSNAKPGYSYHNYGLALDINIKDSSGKIILMKSSSNDNWRKSGVPALAEKLGLIWKGDFGSYHDPIHFYIDANGQSTTQLLAKYNAGQKDQNGYVLI